MNPCQCYDSIEQVNAALQSRDATLRLISWLSSGQDGDDAAKASCRCKRSEISIDIVNAVREACRPFFESYASPRKPGALSPSTPLNDPAPAEKYAEAFPPLMTPKKQDKSDVGRTQKKRIRPQTIQLSQISKSMSQKGNLLMANVESADQPPPPTLSKSYSTPHKTIHRKLSWTAIETPVKLIPRDPFSATQQLVETREVLKNDPRIVNLVDVYVALIENCLVPSILREVYLCLSTLGISAIHSSGSSPQLTTSIFSSILSSDIRCNFFGAKALTKLSLTMKGLGPRLWKQLIKSSCFRSQLPDVAAEYEILMRQYTSQHQGAHEIIPSHQTALLTLPFDEQRDSRHNFKTIADQAAFKNREDTRDRFLYNLRSYLSVRGKGFHDAQAQLAHDRVKAEARTTTELLLDSNIPWFCDFICELLLQIGLVPLQESDKDLRNLASPEKLSKLHQRFSDTRNRNNIARRVLRAEAPSKAAKPVSSPVSEAKQHFTGHQEFFYLFLLYADSYRLGRRLLGGLIERLRDTHARLISISTDINMVRKINEMKMLSRFIGLLAFSPGWSIASSKTSCDCLILLGALGLQLDVVLLNALNEGTLIATVPWISECALMAQWDGMTLNSPEFLRIMAIMKHVQLQVWKGFVAAPCNRLYIVLCIENLLRVTSCSPLRSKHFGMDSWSSHSSIEAQHVSETSDVNRMKRIDSSDCPDLLSTDRYVEELLTLVSKLDQASASVFRSPGASRKLRPSRITDPPTLTNVDKDAKSLNGSEKSISQIDAQLVQLFFHKYPDLKELWEMVFRQLMSSAKRDTMDECIRPSLKGCDMGEDNYASTISTVEEASCAFFKRTLTERSMRVLELLVPTKDPQVREIAVSLLVRRGLDHWESQVHAVVAAEMGRVQTSSKELFPPQALTSHPENGKSKWLLVVDSLKVLLSELESVSSSGIDFSKLEKNLSAAVRACDALLDISNSGLPSDDVLRNYYESVLVLDARYAESTIDWCTKNVTGQDPSIRWSVLSLFLDLAAKLARYSWYGPRALQAALGSRKQTMASIAGLAWAGEGSTDRLISLLEALAEQRIIERCTMEEALASGDIDCPQITQMLGKLTTDDSLRQHKQQ